MKVPLHTYLSSHLVKQGMDRPHRAKFQRCMSPACGGKLLSSSTFCRHLAHRNAVAGPTNQLEASTGPSSSREISSPVLEHPSLIHDPSSPSGTNSSLGDDANDVEPMLDVVQGVAFIDGLLPSPCCGLP